MFDQLKISKKNKLSALCDLSVNMLRNSNDHKIVFCEAPVWPFIIQYKKQLLYTNSFTEDIEDGLVMPTKKIHIFMFYGIPTHCTLKILVVPDFNNGA